MASFKLAGCVGILLLVVTISQAAQLYNFRDFLILGPEPAPKDDIPQRCIDNTVTQVTCGSVISNDALLPHPDDCNLFYYCLTPNHAPICRACPANLHFSPTEHVCDNPEHAGCALYS